ncbi:hypothetical protein SEVIR_8G186350v4 [Setaria viridis]|uniref:Uncharacterized protein n=2 Tax=Setaria TaxID=4554 RepID=A0A368S8Z6_SETIT|nr:UPF0481 protein At3g47200 isoform X2 [Setaria italica]XP_034606826.1 UPF0481 protein At3g47200-like isoform X2 [Setaria viridis]XP_034606860.1 UPF0481 protein At3g47200-like isoform X2 [Setaria viridis]RCV38878.1 hypothetical protein SETIT_8G177900v2 [Setaria italica]TKW01518.1 hypothetical protein SEVIR_8G186300v2 [Setaria viridis]
MEPAAARTFEEPANDEVWDPAAGLPVEYASSIDIFAATQHDGPIVEQAAAQESLEVDLLHDMEMEIYNNNPILVFQEKARKFKDDIGMMKMKIHRYPPSIQDLGDWYTVPRIVAIGPYHHRRQELRHTENVKHVAAYHCIKTSGRSVQDMYYAVVSAVAEIDARRLYREDVMEGIVDADFLPMMFFDACFLVMYMIKMSGMDCNATLYDFFEFSANEIDHDIMLLENQIPWPVVDALLKYTSVPLAKFVANWKDGRLQDWVDEVPSVVLDDSYEPPHLLGLLRFYIVGRTRSRTEVPGIGKMKSIQVSVSAMELAEMGINIRAKKTTELADMGLTKKRILFAELSMAPLSLNDLNASLLVNMAALELCTTPNFFYDEAEFEDSAVCSYLLLLCMLVNRKEDVHHLRTKGILQGGAGLTNTNALHFFTSLQSLRLGRCCGNIMVQIESYRIKRPMRIKVYAFVYNNWKTILKVLSVIGVFASILSAIHSLKGAH